MNQLQLVHDDVLDRLHQAMRDVVAAEKLRWSIVDFHGGDEDMLRIADWHLRAAERNRNDLADTLKTIKTQMGESWTESYV